MVQNQICVSLSEESGPDSFIKERKVTVTAQRQRQEAKMSQSVRESARDFTGLFLR
jgi:hypothetical protein